ncbi:MAG: ribose-phosphate diphosphokinase [Candidatus Binatia bacterium]
MPSPQRTTAQPLPPAVRLHIFADSEAFGRRLARAARTPRCRVRVHTFPDGESLVRVQMSPGRHAVVVRSLHDPNRKLIEVLLAADALRRGGAETVTLIAPYLPYMRQDSVFAPGEPISQRVIGDCLGRAFDGVYTLEAHLHRISRLSEVIPTQAESLSAESVIAQWLQGIGGTYLIVGPDEESQPWVQGIAQAANIPWVVGHKTRAGDRRVHLRFAALPAVERAVIIDDIASSGTTLEKTACLLHQCGIPTVDVIIVHALFPPTVQERLHRAGIRRLVSCDTIPHPTNTITTASLFAPLITRLSE